MKKRIIFSVAAVLIVIAGVLSLTVYMVLFRNNITKEGYLYINERLLPDEFISQVHSSGFFKNTSNLRLAAKIERLSYAEPGRYRIELGMGNREVVRMVKFGWQTPVNVTISGNIRTKERLAAALSKGLRADSSALIQMLRNDSLANSLGFDSNNILGMFIPDTYQFFWTARPEDIAQRFKKEYDNFWNESRLKKAENLGLSQKEVVTLASIVSEESNLKSEYPIIAGVYLNRLRNGIPLQADPTVKFALGDFTIKRVLFKHLEVNSAFNTYKYKGLPPGPITIPSADVIDSVLNTKRHKYFYFCAKETLDGTHAFSETLSEHNKKARAYQSALNRLKIR